MILSLNEIENMVRKAACGAGLAFGLAQDAGRAAAIAQAAGLDGVKAAYLGLTVTTPLQIDPPLPAGVEASQIAACIAALDSLAAGLCARVKIRHLVSAPMLAALAVVTAREQAVAFRIIFDSGECHASAQGLVDAAKLPEGKCDLTLECVAPPKEQSSAPAAAPPSHNSAHWQTLAALAARTYVPESAQSRLSGAGAGLTDND